MTGLFAEPGDTILHLVSRNYIPNKVAFGEMLLRLGSNIEATNDSGHKAMDVSRHNSIEFEPMVQYMYDTNSAYQSTSGLCPQPPAPRSPPRLFSHQSTIEHPP